MHMLSEYIFYLWIGEFSLIKHILHLSFSCAFPKLRISDRGSISSSMTKGENIISKGENTLLGGVIF
jgi:hypothetical protein